MSDAAGLRKGYNRNSPNLIRLDEFSLFPVVARRICRATEGAISNGKTRFQELKRPNAF